MINSETFTGKRLNATPAAPAAVPRSEHGSSRGSRWNDRAEPTRRRTGLRILAFCALLGLVPALVLIASLPANGSTPPTSGRSLDVVGGPVAAGADVVVVSVDRSHTLHLDGVNPVTDTVLWQRPYAASAITPGIALTPAAAGTTVADIVPAANSATPSVTVDGDQRGDGGRSCGRCPCDFILSDNPAPLRRWSGFCLPAYTADGSAQLTIIDAATGQPSSVLSGPSRALGTDLYQSSNETPTLDQLSATGSIAWSEPVTTIFGPGYDPGTGWNISPVGDLDVGSVGVAANGTAADLSRYKTVGLLHRNGRAAVVDPRFVPVHGSARLLEHAGHLPVQGHRPLLEDLHQAALPARGDLDAGRLRPGDADRPPGPTRSAM